MEIFLSNYIIIYSLYSVELPIWFEIIRFLFQLYPPFSFSKIYSDIAIKSGHHFDFDDWRWVDVNYY